MSASVTFREIVRAVRDVPLPRFDVVLGIARGGTVLASLIAYRLDSPLRIVRYSFRDDDNRPRHAAPRLLQAADLPEGASHILLVDDVSVTGQTLRAAREGLRGLDVTTLVLKGSADVVLFPDIQTCQDWPWNPANA